MQTQKGKLNAQATRRRLEKMADEGYRLFQSKLLPGCPQPLLGVRMPALHALAKEICRSDWRAFLSGPVGGTYEERMLRGLVVCGAEMPGAERFEHTAAFVPLIDNWAVCDSFCIRLRLARACPEAMWDFLQPYLQSGLEYEARFGVVMLLDHFVTSAWIAPVLQALCRVAQPDYYARMAVAWALSACYCRFPAQTLRALEQGNFDDFTYNKALQKICESRQVKPDEKGRLRALKRG